jgi:hypothetical protein
VREAAQLGFSRVIAPEGNVPDSDVPRGVTFVGVRTVNEALEALM